MIAGFLLGELPLDDSLCWLGLVVLHGLFLRLGSLELACLMCLNKGLKV